MTAYRRVVARTLGRSFRSVGEEFVLVKSGGRAAALPKKRRTLIVYLVEPLQNLPPF
jgi:hypothetical protein